MAITRESLNGWALFYDTEEKRMKFYADRKASAVAAARADETERCALLCKMRGDIARGSAQKLRERGTYTTWAIWPPFKPMTYVAPRWEAAAQDHEAVGKAFDVVADCIRKGYDPRTLPGYRK